MLDSQPAAPSFDPVECLEAFAHIGQGGTPKGMISSSWSPVATGQIGGVEVTGDTDSSVERPRPRAWKAVAGGLFVSVALLVLGWQLMRARSERPALAAAPESTVVIVAPPPTPALEDVARVVPTPEVEPPRLEAEAAVARDTKQGRSGRKKVSSGSKNGGSSQACEEQKQKADDLLDLGHWDEVLALTRSAKCWPEANDRKLLRMRALFELHRFDDCIAIGRGSSDTKIKEMTGTCTKKQAASQK